MSRTAIGALILVGAVSLYAEELPKEPTGFGGVAWGASVETMQTKRRRCDLQVNETGAEARLRVCAKDDAIGRVPVVANYDFDEKQGLVRVRLLFDSKEYGFVSAAFRERYGAPTSETLDTMQNRMGAKVKSGVLEWDGPTVHIGLLQHYGNLDNSFAVMTRQSWSEAAEKEAEESKKKAAASLD